MNKKIQLKAQQYNNSILALIQKGPYLQRLLTASQAFLNCPYQTGALGEDVYGEINQQPLYRNDQFDCLTYVNTVIALAKATDLESFQQCMKQLSYYEQDINYFQRFHFMSADWNPMNQQAGIISDITLHIGVPAEHTHEASVLIDRKNWYAMHTADRLQLDDQKQQTAALEKLKQHAKVVENAHVTMPYIDHEYLLQASSQAKLMQSLPSICIAEMVRPNWDLRKEIGTCLNVSHLGFLLNNGKQLRFRHAGQLCRRITEEDWLVYLKRQIDQPSFAGVNLQAIVGV